MKVTDSKHVGRIQINESEFHHFTKEEKLEKLKAKNERQRKNGGRITNNEVEDFEYRAFKIEEVDGEVSKSHINIRTNLVLESGYYDLFSSWVIRDMDIPLMNVLLLINEKGTIIKEEVV